MYTRLRMMIVFLVLFMGVLLFAFQVHASSSIAEISSFEGEVIIQSDTMLSQVTQVGVMLHEGDRIQTKQGDVRITFNDGAVMKVSPFTNVMIQERKEKKGWWLFKTARLSRRTTCFVGKLWFKSGASTTKNYLQSPTAVCGLRGSEGDFGFDNHNTYLNMYTGNAKVCGKVRREAFAGFGPETAIASEVYHATVKAYEASKRAKYTGKPIDLVKARVEALRVLKKAATELHKSCDCLVAMEAQVASNVADANIAASKAEVAVEQLKEAGASDGDIQTAKDAAADSRVQASLANEAADKIYVDGVLDPGTFDNAIKDTETAATNAKAAARVATDIRSQVVPSEEVPVEVPTEKVPIEEVVPLEEAPLEEVLPEHIDSQTSEQEHYWEEGREASPSQ